MIIKVRIENEEFEVFIQDLASRPIIAMIGEDIFEVFPEEAGLPITEQSRTLQTEPKASSQTLQAPKTKNGHGPVLRSPLPGVITQICVKTGEAVTVGQEVMRLDAMKMSNSIRATHSGTVAKILVDLGQQVKHGDTLISIDHKGMTV
jgi:biotin carboxyl carrier protein